MIRACRAPWESLCGVAHAREAVVIVVSSRRFPLTLCERHALASLIAANLGLSLLRSEALPVSDERGKEQQARDRTRSSAPRSPALVWARHAGYASTAEAHLSHIWDVL